MNAVEIEEAVSALAERPFDPAEFPFEFLTAFDNKETTIRRLRGGSGSTNKSDVGGVLQTNNIHIAVAPAGEVTKALASLRESPATTRFKAKFILATDGDTFEAEDIDNGETVACTYADFPNHFGFFLPLAGISTVKQIRDSSFDIRATSRLNRLYVELLKDNPEWGTAERRPDMNHFMARLIFCFFAEDTDIFGSDAHFTAKVEEMSAKDSSNTHTDLQTERAALRAILKHAQERLGPHQDGDDRSDPRLMAYLALNLLEPSNWELAEDEDSRQGWRYNPPADELAHFAPLQARVAANNSDLSHTMAINTLLDDPSKGTPQAAAALVAWAEAKLASNSETPEAIDQAIVGAAMIAMRDGAPELRRDKRAWAEMQFARALTEKADVGRRMRNGILYNPVAMAFAGRLYTLSDATPSQDDLKRVLAMVAADPAAARGAPQAAATIDALDPRLRCSILRVAFASSAFFWHPWDADGEIKRQADADQKKLVDRAIDAELSWLKGEGAEPAWPAFAEGEIRTRGRRRGIRIGVPREPEPPPPARDESRRFVDHQTAALWLSALTSKAGADKQWMAAIEDAYASWTFAANGAGLPENEDVEAPDEWNAAFFTVMTTNFRGKTLATIETALRPIFALNDDQFFDLTENVLYKSDVLYFNEKALEPNVAVGIRGLFADRMAKSYGYQRLRSKNSDGIEMHLGPALATVFLCEHVFGQAPRCYLPAGFVEPSLLFIPLLMPLAERAPCLFVGMCVMSWVEREPTSAHLPLVVTFASAAIEARPDDKTFWSDHGMGARISNWLSARLAADPEALSVTAPFRADIDGVVAKFVAMGIAEARRLEVALAKGD